MYKLTPLVLLVLLGCKSAEETCEDESLTITGTVFDMDGLPFEGANVRASVSATDDTIDEDADSTNARTADVTTTSDSSGAFSLSLDAGTWSVHAWMEGDEDTGYGGGFGCESEVLELTSADCTDLSQDFVMDVCSYED
jgi:hypothetical protein